MSHLCQKPGWHSLHTFREMADSAFREKLSNAEPNVRLAALQQLAGASADPELLPDLLRICLNDRTGHNRLAAVKALKAYWPHPEVQAAYSARLSDELYIAAEVVATLGRVADQPAVAMLEKSFETSSSIWVRIKVLGQMHRAPQAQLHRFIAQSGCLSHKDERIRAATVALLARVKNPSLKQVFAQRLKDPCPRVRSNALESLGAGFPDQETAKLMVACLADPHHRVRSVAIKFLLEFGVTQAEEHLRAMVESTSFLFRGAAAWVLREVAPNEKRVQWIHALAQDPSEQVSSMAEMALAQHGPSGA